MDGVASLASGILGSQAAALQTQVATRLLKTSLDAEKSAVATLLAPSQTPAATPLGTGGNLDISV